MPKMCLSGCSFCVLLWHSILLPEDTKYWMPGIIPFNKCVCDFYHIQAVCSVFVDMKDHQMVQSAVRSGRTEVCLYPLHGRKWSLTDCISSRYDKENFCQCIDLGYKSLRCCTWWWHKLHQFFHSVNCWFRKVPESPAAPLTCPPWSHLFTTEGLHPRVPRSPLLVGNVKTIPVYFWIRSSLFVRQH